MDIQLGNPENIYLLAIVAMCLVLTGFAIVARRRAALKFATANLRQRILPTRTRSRHWLSGLLVAGSLTLMVVSLMDVRWGRS